MRQINLWIIKGNESLDKELENHINQAIKKTEAIIKDIEIKKEIKSILELSDSILNTKPPHIILYLIKEKTIEPTMFYSYLSVNAIQSKNRDNFRVYQSNDPGEWEQQPEEFHEYRRLVEWEVQDSDKKLLNVFGCPDKKGPDEKDCIYKNGYLPIAPLPLPIVIIPDELLQEIIHGLQFGGLSKYFNVQKDDTISEIQGSLWLLFHERMELPLRLPYSTWLMLIHELLVKNFQKKGCCNLQDYFDNEQLNWISSYLGKGGLKDYISDLLHTLFPGKSFSPPTTGTNLKSSSQQPELLELVAGLDGFSDNLVDPDNPLIEEVLTLWLSMYILMYIAPGVKLTDEEYSRVSAHVKPFDCNNISWSYLRSELSAHLIMRWWHAFYLYIMYVEPKKSMPFEPFWQYVKEKLIQDRNLPQWEELRLILQNLSEKYEESIVGYAREHIQPGSLFGFTHAVQLDTILTHMSEARYLIYLSYLLNKLYPGDQCKECPYPALRVLFHDNRGRREPKLPGLASILELISPLRERLSQLVNNKHPKYDEWDSYKWMPKFYGSAHGKNIQNPMIDLVSIPYETVTEMVEDLTKNNNMRPILTTSLLLNILHGGKGDKVFTEEEPPIPILTLIDYSLETTDDLSAMRLTHAGHIIEELMLTRILPLSYRDNRGKLKFLNEKAGPYWMFLASRHPIQIYRNIQDGGIGMWYNQVFLHPGDDPTRVWRRPITAMKLYPLITSQFHYPLVTYLFTLSRLGDEIDDYYKIFDKYKRDYNALLSDLITLGWFIHGLLDRLFRLFESPFPLDVIKDQDDGISRLLVDMFPDRLKRMAYFTNFSVLGELSPFALIMNPLGFRPKRHTSEEWIYLPMDLQYLILHGCWKGNVDISKVKVNGYKSLVNWINQPDSAVLPKLWSETLIDTLKRVNRQLHDVLSILDGPQPLSDPSVSQRIKDIAIAYIDSEDIPELFKKMARIWIGAREKIEDKEV